MRLWAGGILALVLVTAAAAQQAEPSARAKAAAEAFIASIDAFKTRQRALPPAKDFAEELARRIELDQFVRNQSWRDGLTIEEQNAAYPVLVRQSLLDVDNDNTAWLKARLPADGWFRISRDGAPVASNAFLIVQHSQDRAWQKEILARMEPLAKSGEVSPQSFALLYDRVQLFDTGKQTYGSQATCQNGKLGMAPMDEPEKVQERRDAIGFSRPRYDEYRKMFEGEDC